jgi:pimeloyl-ACP methyl ester carboxylesterase
MMCGVSRPPSSGSDEIWLLLHGTPLTPRVWDAVGSRLMSGRPVVAPRLPANTCPAGAQAEIAREVLASLGEPAAGLHVVGHSFGGQVAIEVALAAPQRVCSLAILCSRASPFPAFSEIAASLRRGEPVDVEQTLSRWFVPGELAAGGPLVDYARTCIADADPALWANDLDAIAVYDRRDALSEIRTPTTVIAAEQDRVGNPDEMGAIADAIPEAQLVLVPQASHMSQFLDPDALAARLSGLARRSRSDRPATRGGR